MLYKGWRFRKLSDKRLVSLVVEKLKEVGDVGWREEFELLLRKYGLEKEGRRSAAASLEEPAAERGRELGRLV